MKSGTKQLILNLVLFLLLLLGGMYVTYAQADEPAVSDNFTEDVLKYPHTCKDSNGDVYFLYPGLAVGYLKGLNGFLDSIFIYDTTGKLHQFTQGQPNDKCVPAKTPMWT